MSIDSLFEFDIIMNESKREAAKYLNIQDFKAGSPLEHNMIRYMGDYDSLKEYYKTCNKKHENKSYRSRIKEEIRNFDSFEEFKRFRRSMYNYIAEKNHDDILYWFMEDRLKKPKEDFFEEDT